MNIENIIDDHRMVGVHIKIVKHAAIYDDSAGIVEKYEDGGIYCRP